MNKTDTKLIKSLSDLKESTIELFDRASKEISIYARDLDPRVLNNREVEFAVTRFIKKSRYCKVNILIESEQKLTGIDHRLVTLAQRFSSFIQIKLIPLDYQDNYFGFYMSDNSSMLYRNNIERYETELLNLPNSKLKEKSKFFGHLWQLASPASFLRSLHL